MAETAVVATTEAKTPIAVGRNGIQIGTLNDLYRFAQYVAESGFAPKDMKESPIKILVAMEMGMEVGLPLMQSIQNVAVINGRPTVWGDSAKALVESSGLCEEHKEFFEGKPYEKGFKAVCETKRRGRTKVRWEFSVEDAMRAGLWQTEAKVKRRGKNGGEYMANNDSPWYRYPKRMMQMRARGFALRDAYPDVLKGLYLREEMEGAPPIDVTAETEVIETTNSAPTSLDDLADDLDEVPSPTPANTEVVDEETGEVLQEETQATEEETPKESLF